jgi:hypothetical protein
LVSAGLSVRVVTRYFNPLKMIIGTSYFQRLLYKIFMKNVQILRKVLSVNKDVLVHLKNIESSGYKLLAIQG